MRYFIKKEYRSLIYSDLKFHETIVKGREKMNTNELLLYLKSVRDLEQICYTCNRSINNLQYRADRLGICKNFVEPIKPSSYSSDWEFQEIYGCAYVVSLILCFIFFQYMWPDMFGAIWILGIICAVVFCLFAGFLVALPVSAIILIAIYIYHRHDYPKQYEKEMTSYLSKVKQDEIRVRNELQVKKNILAQRDILKSSFNNTRKLLDKLYSYNIIYSKYRNMVAVTMFCEYLESGICTQLKGHEGAYNQFEKELRDRIIIAELKTISSQLESIRQTQYMLYEEVKRGNDTANRILKSAERMEDNSEIEKYNSEVIAQNSAIIAQETKMQSIWRDFSNM